jgi:hypothetical protein
MKIAIMQPYLFPYIGYFQLINSADKFVVYDDVTYIKQGWINRNRILINGGASMFTIPLEKASSYRKIHDIKIKDLYKWRMIFLKTLDQNYKKAPFFKSTYDIVDKVLTSLSTDISRLNLNGISLILQYLDIQTKIVETSRVYDNEYLKSQSRVIDICKRENAKSYINFINGSSLYSKENFLNNGIDLLFINSEPIRYNQYNSKFVPRLSIIDVMMFNSPNKIKHYLSKYHLLR